MAGCELLPKSYKLTVQVKDFYSNPISAKVNLLKNGKIIASKTGSIVVFEDLEKGTYLLEGINPEIEKKTSKTVTITNNDVITSLRFELFSTEDGKVHEIIFDASAEKSFIIEELAKDENIIMGIATLNFDTMDGSYGYINVNLERNSSDKSADYIIKPLEVKNPVYVYREPVLREVPQIISIDHYLRQQEKLLLSSIQRPILAAFDGKEYKKGHKKSFYCAVRDWAEISTTVQAIGDYCIIFVDDTVDFYTEEDIARYVEEFDNNIYPIMTDFFSPHFDIDDTWINEGMSTYAQQITGYVDVDNRIYEYFSEKYSIPTSMVSLLFWDQNLHDYGISNLFTNYIAEQFGKEILQHIYANAVDPLIPSPDYREGYRFQSGAPGL